jgi:DNA repair exonuclease SbcCD ATPase subunit
VFDERTGTNRVAKEKRATIAQLKQAMPQAPAGVTGSEDELRQQVADANAAKDAELDRVRTKMDGIKTENQRQIDEIRAEAQARIDAIVAEQAATESKAAAKREHVIQQHAATVEPLNQALEIIKANRENVAKREQAIATIEQMEAEAATLEQQAETQTQALADLDQYKIELLANLPIPGIEVHDGEIFRDGVQFDRLNTAQQVEIAVEIAKLRSGELGVICVDGLELLDADHYQAFRDAAVASGLQLFVTRVAGEGFNIATDSAPADPVEATAPAAPAKRQARTAKAASNPPVVQAPAQTIPAPVIGDDFDF